MKNLVCIFLLYWTNKWRNEACGRE